MLEPAKKGIRNHSAFANPRLNPSIESGSDTEVLAEPADRVVVVGAPDQVAHDEGGRDSQCGDQRIRGDRHTGGQRQGEIAVARRQDQQPLGVRVDPARPHPGRHVGGDHERHEGNECQRSPCRPDVGNVVGGVDRCALGHGVQRYRVGWTAGRRRAVPFAPCRASCKMCRSPSLTSSNVPRSTTLTRESSRRPAPGRNVRRTVSGRLAPASSVACSTTSASRADGRVGTFAWNTARHLELYFAAPCTGRVLHTLNIRLFPEQLTYIVNHADDEVIFVDRSLLGTARPAVADVRAARSIWC